MKISLPNPFNCKSWQLHPRVGTTLVQYEVVRSIKPKLAKGRSRFKPASEAKERGAMSSVGSIVNISQRG